VAIVNWSTTCSGLCEFYKSSAFGGKVAAAGGFDGHVILSGDFIQVLSSTNVLFGEAGFARWREGNILMREKVC
jgi:hypothetical protein